MMKYIIFLLIGFSGFAQRGNYYYSLGAVDSAVVLPYSASYQAVLDYADANGITKADVGYRQGQSDLLDVVAGLKADWFANFLGDQSGFALINQLDPDSNMAVNVEATFTTNEGFKAIISSQGIVTNYNPFTDKIYWKTDSVFAAYWVKNFNKNNNVASGANAGFDFNVRYHTDGTIKTRINGSASVSITPTYALQDSTGLLIITRIGGTLKAWFNGVAMGTVSHSGATGIPDQIIGICGDYGGSFSANVNYPFGLVIFGGSISDSEITTLTNAVNAYYSLALAVSP